MIRFSLLVVCLVSFTIASNAQQVKENFGTSSADDASNFNKARKIEKVIVYFKSVENLSVSEETLAEKVMEEAPHFPLWQGESYQELVQEHKLTEVLEEWIASHPDEYKQFKLIINQALEGEPIAPLK